MAQRVYYGTICEGAGSYGIVFLDFLGCVSAGDTIEEVIAMGHEALQLHIEGMTADGDPIPEPSVVTIERTQAELDDSEDPVMDEQWVSVVPILVDVPGDLESLPVPIDAALIREIDRHSKDRRQFIMDAARRELDRLAKSA